MTEPPTDDPAPDLAAEIAALAERPGPPAAGAVPTHPVTDPAPVPKRKATDPTAAERMRRWRRRHRYRRIVVPMEVTESMLDALVAAGALPDSEAVDREAIGRALAGYVALAMVRKK